GEAPARGGAGVAATRSDSAGVRIVRSVGEATLVAEVILRVGVLSGDPAHQFHGVGALAVSDEGGVWVADSNESIRYYDAAGTYVRSLGRRGSGPGESPDGYFNVWTGGGRLFASTGAFLQVFDAETGAYLESHRNVVGNTFVVPLAR